MTELGKMICVVIFCTTTMIVVSISAFRNGKQSGINEMELKAINEGHGEYYLNKDNEKEFRFKDK